ncbi:MAG: SAM-dependent methyltransferase [Clostridiales bacterium]|nr:MAG: SAM-dependent methyltransferase [Clostridiales bacterium]
MIRTDELFVNNLKIYQDADNFCFGTDSLLLAQFSFKKKTTAMCDLCTGTGVLPLLASAHTKSEKTYGVEISPQTAELAKKSVSLNNLEDRVEIINGDIRYIKEFLPNAMFDLVTANPPYMPQNSGFLSDIKRRTARAETDCTPSDICTAARYLLKNKGRLCVVYRADRLTELFESMKKNGIEPKRLLTVQSKPENDPYVILCEGIVGGSPGLKIEKPLVINNGENRWSYLNAAK